MTRYPALFGILASSLAVTPAAAQEPAAVTGVVTDASGGILPASMDDLPLEATAGEHPELALG